MDRPLIGVVMAGGTGTRLYPASRSDRSKQFLALDGERSLLRRTVDRLSFADEVYVVTSDAHADRVREHVPEAGVIVEPAARDTGPALVYAAHRLRNARRGPVDGTAGEETAGDGTTDDGTTDDERRERAADPVLCCVPSDHRVAGDFAATMRAAAAAAVETNGLITVGIEPDGPSTGYGYIRPGRAGDGHYAVDSFHEKPDASAAKRFVEDGFYWNAGIFAWTPDALLREARGTPLGPLVEALDAGDPERGFAAAESISVDYAVMERTDDAYVVPASFEWDDLGAWDALDRLSDGENAVVGDALTIDAAGNVIASDDKHVSVVGVADLVVAAYGDRVLVVPKEDAQRVREVVAELRGDGRF